MRVIVEEIVRSHPAKAESFRRERWRDHSIEPRLIVENAEMATLWRTKEGGQRERLTVMATRLISDDEDLVLLLDAITEGVWEAMEPWMRKKYNYTSVLEPENIPADRYEAWAVEHGVWP